MQEAPKSLTQAQWDVYIKQSWAARGVTDYAEQLKQWKQKGVHVPADHPFYRFLRIQPPAPKKKQATLW